MGFHRPALAAIVALVTAQALWCPAQTPLEKVPSEGQLRAAAIVPAHNSVYFAVYDRNEVWQVDPGSRATVASVPVGRGPAALASSADGSILACLNSLSDTLTLIHIPEMTVAATVLCGKGACEVAALPGGGFAVANSFADSVTIVDPQRPLAPTTIEGVTSVPNGVAASDAFLAVTTRFPPALLLYKPGAASPAATIALPDIPGSVAALRDGRFAAATRTNFYIIDANLRRIIAQYPMNIADFAVVDTDLYALSGDSVHIFSLDLYQTGSLSVEPGTRAIAASRELVVAVDPVKRIWYVHGALPPVVAKPEEKLPSPEEAEPPKPPPEPELEPEPEVTEAPSPVLIIEAEPTAAPEQAEKTAETQPAAEVEEAEKPPEVPAAPARPKRPTWESLRPTPLGGRETAAPRFRRAPGPPGRELGPEGISEALARGLDLAGEAPAFQPPDWRQPWRNMTFDWYQQTEHEIHAGNVGLTLDTLQCRADEFYYELDTGEMDARGNVALRQHESVLLADHVHYVVPPEARLTLEREPYRLVSEEQELADQELAREVLSLGRLTAENVYLGDPFREMRAESITYDLATKTGEAAGVRGRIGEIYFGGRELRVLGPGSIEGEDLWVTTCDRDPPHYRVRIKKASIQEGETFRGTGAQLQIGKVETPLYWPRWAYHVSRGRTFGLELESGRRANIGYYVNYGQWFAVNPDVHLALRLYPTEKAGVGLGLEGNYDFMETPTSFLFRGKGEFRTMVTTKESGRAELYHRHEPYEDTVLLLQWEQWFERDFVKDFYYDEYRNRTEPRTFANLTYTQPDYIATATVRKTTNDFVAETERAPEITFHLLERPLVGPLYFTFDTIDGYNEREPAGTHAARSVNVARLTLDWDLDEAFSITPFLELEGSWYSEQFRSEQDDLRFSSTFGTTLQTRLHRLFPGRFGFSGFKHLVVPSLTVSYRPEATMEVDETPRFDAYDNVYGRARIETKIDNIFYGRDAETNEVWQVARLTLYQGNDFWNELRKADDYELELDLRPRPWWGFQIAAERHLTSKDIDIDAPFFFQRRILELAERLIDRPIDPELVFRYNARYADYDRILSYIYYDDTILDGRFNGRIGFAYTKTRDEVFNREILYGLGYKLSDKWSVAFEHRYDFERDELYRQTYEIRRNLHCWEAGLRFRERREGWDVSFELSLVAFPGAKVKF